MKQQTVNQLIRRVLSAIDNGRSDLAEAPLVLPANVFTDPVRFRRERERFFRRSPQPVGFSCELSESGSAMALEAMGVPVVLTRGEDGLLRAFVNACAHRGAPVCREKQTGRRRLVCSFHGWAYALDGSLVGLPQKACFEQPDFEGALCRLPVSEKYGIVVLGLDPEISQAAVDGALDEIGPEIENFDFGDYRFLAAKRFEVKANWKLIAGLSHESYHFAVLHRNSVAEVLRDDFVVDTFGSHSRWCFPRKEVVALKETPEAEWPDCFPGACNHTLFPGTVVISNATGVQMIRLEPGRHPGETTVFYSGAYKPGVDPDAARAAFEFGGEVFEKEDLWAAERCQQGIAARGRELIIGRNEPIVQFWHRLWEDSLPG